MRKLTIVTMSLLLFTGIMACKEKSDGHDHNMKMANKKGSRTKVVLSQNMQFAFDLMSMKAHMKMMKAMKMEMKHSSSATHVLMITLINKDTKSLVKNATGKITVESTGSATLSKMLMPMSGGGMYHYGADLNLKKGEYKITANVVVDSKKYTAKANFKL